MSGLERRFSRFLERLVGVARADDRVVAVVGMGSTAARERVDEWSDHDFALVTRPGFEDVFRHDLSWLPASDRIALSVVEDHGGVKVVYDDGHVLEFGITDVAGLAGWKANAYDVLTGPPEVHAAMAAIAVRPAGETAERDVALVLTQVLIGVGRARRGERLNASDVIRGQAVGHLLRAAAGRLPLDRRAALDDLDPTRRVEQAFPGLASRIERLLVLDVEECARGLLDLTTELLEPGWPGFPRRGVDAVRRRLGWTG
ncbi:hypothetical protein ACFFGH_11035 [Lysobacter korlensis]|uniref:Nucleotidyltransferase domain-containing protein n=1 Tax=Lysobacter korlensis TaxID=553636 RepID=A0ABV6RN15_9GAMM